MEIISNFKLPRQYWAVGSSYGGVNDQTKKFLVENVWIEGWGLSDDNRNKRVLDEIQIDDILAMKSSATKGAGHSITFTKLKAIGIVTDRINYFTFTVNWLDTNNLPIDFDGIRYGKTIEPLRNDELLKYIKGILGDQ